MDKVSTEVRRQQWCDIINSCNASGLARKDWYEQNGIKLKTFYYWQRQLRRDAYDDAHTNTLPAVPKVTFVEVELPSSDKTGDGFYNRFSSGCSHPDPYLDNRSIKPGIQGSALADQDGDEECYVKKVIRFDSILCFFQCLLVQVHHLKPFSLMRPPPSLRIRKEQARGYPVS